MAKGTWTKETRVFLFEACVEEQNLGLEAKMEEPFPLGLAYLSRILKDAGYKVKAKDYAYWKEKKYLIDLKKIIESFKPDIVGISVMSMTRVSTYHGIKLIKKINSDIKIILGGIHSSIMYKQLLENFPIDAVCIGEAEDTILELLDALQKGKSLKRIKGIAYKNRRGKSKGKIIITPPRPLIHDLNRIPFPDHKSFVNPKVKQVYMITSRGCPYRCSFCCLHAISHQIWRPRDYMNVVDEIEYIANNFPWVTDITFHDDTLTLDNKRVVNICKEIVKRGIKMRFQCSARIKPVSKEMFYWMEKAGFNEIRFGIETGSPKLMKAIHKGITQEDCIKTFKMLKPFKKIKVVKFLMVGFPGETDETINETIEFVKKLQKIIKMDFFYATPLWIYPETEIYDIAKKAGFMDDNYWLTDKPCPLFTVEHSEKKLKEMSNRISIETILAQGKIYFLGLMLKKIIKYPKYYIARMTQITLKDFNRIIKKYLLRI